MKNEEMKKVAIKASVFALISITVMLQRSATKHIMITDAAGAPIDRGSSETSYTLLVDRQVPEGKENTLIIPLSKSVSSDNIVLEDGYVDHELRIYIDSRDEGFYKDNPVVTDLDILESATCISENDTGNVCLDFKLDGLYANESSLTESSTIEVKFYKPSEKYDRIVVVDPRAGGSDSGQTGQGLSEKDITLETALLLKSIADKDYDNDIKLYFTRLTDDNVDQEKRLDLVRDSEADFFVELSAETSQDAGEGGMTAYYNDSYFLRRLTNVDFADMILRGCATKAGAEGIGLFPAGDEDFLLKESEIPSARISLGHISGSDDSVKLSDEAYRKKMAEGIYAGILEAFEVTE